MGPVGASLTTSRSASPLATFVADDLDLEDPLLRALDIPWQHRASRSTSSAPNRGLGRQALDGVRRGRHLDADDPIHPPGRGMMSHGESTSAAGSAVAGRYRRQPCEYAEPVTTPIRRRVLGRWRPWQRRRGAPAIRRREASLPERASRVRRHHHRRDPLATHRTLPREVGRRRPVAGAAGWVGPSSSCRWPWSGRRRHW